MFDEFGRPIAAPIYPFSNSAGSTFPAMQGYGTSPASTPYFDNPNAPSSLTNWQNNMPSVQTLSASDLGKVTIPDLGGLASVNSAKPGSIWDSFFTKTENDITKQGWGGMALGAGSSLMNGILGFQQLGIAKDTLAQNKKQFDINFAAQQKTTNARLADRQAARVAYGAGATPVSEYMAKYGI